MKSLRLKKSFKNIKKSILSRYSNKLNKRVKKKILRSKNSKKNKRKNKRKSYKARGGFVSYAPLPCIGPQHVGTVIGGDSIFTIDNIAKAKEVLEGKRNPKITTEDIGKQWFGDPKEYGSDIGNNICIKNNMKAIPESTQATISKAELHSMKQIIKNHEAKMHI